MRLLPVAVAALFLAGCDTLKFLVTGPSGGARLIVGATAGRPSADGRQRIVQTGKGQMPDLILAWFRRIDDLKTPVTFEVWLNQFGTRQTVYKEQSSERDAILMYSNLPKPAVPEDFAVRVTGNGEKFTCLTITDASSSKTVGTAPATFSIEGTRILSMAANETFVNGGRLGIEISQKGQVKASAELQYMDLSPNLTPIDLMPTVSYPLPWTGSYPE